MDQPTFDAARQVAAVAELTSVRVVRCKFSAAPDTMALGEKVSLSVRTKSNARLSAEGAAVCNFSFELSATIEGSELDRIEVSVDFKALYSLHDKKFSQKQLKAFAGTNGLLNVWPYWRELVQSFTLRAGLPALTLPLFRVLLAKPVAPTAIQEPKEDSQ